MDISHSKILLITFTFSLFLILPSSKPVSDYTTLVYKTCADATQTFNHKSYSQTLNSLFQNLVTQSSQYKFFKTYESLNDNTFISGLFQCRNDISKEDCFTCVTSLPHHISNTLCKDSTSARVQLHGCYIQYYYKTEEELLDIKTTSEFKNSNMFHKDCGVPIVAFKELMDDAFFILESGILNSDDGFYTTYYKSVKLMAQCEGDLKSCECRECVSDAVQVVKEECGGSVMAQIYLDKCFISYRYMSGDYGNFVPGNFK